jgi:hypothetical protein
MTSEQQDKLLTAIEAMQMVSYFTNTAQQFLKTMHGPDKDQLAFNLEQIAKETLKAASNVVEAVKSTFETEPTF